MALQRSGHFLRPHPEWRGVHGGRNLGAGERGLVQHCAEGCRAAQGWAGLCACPAQSAAWQEELRGWGMVYMLDGPEPRKRMVWIGTVQDWESIPTRSYYRGDPVNESIIKEFEFIFFKEKGRLTPDLFYVFGLQYIGCSEKCRVFLEKNANGSCEFVPMNVYHGKGDWKPWRGKKKEAVEEKFYFVNINRRLDSVDWDHSAAKPYNGIVYEYSAADPNAGALGGAVIWPDKHERDGKVFHFKNSALTFKKNKIRGNHIWHEHLNNSEKAAEIFISNEIAAAIKSNLNLACSMVEMPEVN